MDILNEKKLKDLINKFLEDKTPPDFIVDKLFFLLEAICSENINWASDKYRQILDEYYRDIDDKVSDLEFFIEALDDDDEDNVSENVQEARTETDESVKQNNIPIKLQSNVGEIIDNSVQENIQREPVIHLIQQNSKDTQVDLISESTNTAVEDSVDDQNLLNGSVKQSDSNLTQPIDNKSTDTEEITKIQQELQNLG